ncbi:Ig-like domain-containing protein [Bradyrhizobium sp. Arg237L]|uniref:Ig-like domain-containing protein n=1 Tax=Bradyrhizobium sp. Arg237L TaxID=3003352 RepID=UPI00249DB845|nr:Ig-like domain-containing protein [Bradyrhizobium sp. Arg237L]MDI4231375.1 Ig-like domain-containing protein [Bradyrhizobium sp. Arg237L]
MVSIPLSWNDPMFNSVTNINGASVAQGGTLSNKSISDMSSGDASVGGTGSFNLDTVRIDSREGVRVGTGGDFNINNSYIETTGLAGDHADGIQAYAPGASGNITVTNSSIVSHNNSNATAGIWIADNYGGSLTLDNVMFEGGPYGLRIAADDQDITVALKDVYFVGPFGGGPLLFQQVNAKIHITQWENVRTATIVNGQLVPGDLIPAPLPVEGGGAPSTPPSNPLDAPVIASYSNDTGKVGDGITSDNTLQLKGTAAANSTIKIFDGTKQIGTTTANASGGWEYITSVLTNAQHVLKATATNTSGQTSAASAALTVTVDNIAPTAPAVKSDSVVDTNKVLLSGTAEAGSTIKVYEGTNLVGTGTTAANGTWSITTSAMSTGSHTLTTTATDVAGNVSAASQVVDPVIGGPTTTPPTQPSATPKIVSFSNDSGKAGDNITNDNTLTLKGTAQANATVKVFDGNTQVGSIKADASGNWSLTTAALKDGAHSLTATGTDSSGKASATSTALAVTIDTTAPTAPALKANSVVDTSHVQLSGTAEAGNTVKVYDGSNVVGTATAGTNGSWSVTTSALSNGTHDLTAKATDVAGNVSAASQPFHSVIGGGSTTPSGLTGLVQVDNHYFLGATGPELKYSGAAVTAGQFDDWIPISSVKLDGGGYDVAWKDSSGQFTFWTTDSQGNFKFYPTHGVALAANSTTVQSYETIFHQDLNGDHTIGVPGTTPTTPTTPASAVNFSSLTTSSSNVVTMKGTADAFSQVKMYDGKAYIGTTSAGADGNWSFTSTSAVSNTVHSFKAVGVDSAGHTTASSGSAILGSTGSNTLTSTSGNDLFVGKGHPDTFVFAANFGKDVIKDFAASGPSHDTIQFSKSAFSDFASVLNHASQVGQDVVIANGADSLTLKNTKLGALQSHDFHFA